MDGCFNVFCRKANRMHESRADDITKLLQFFTYCKQQNPQFFCDFQLDGEGKILSLFWSHASQQGEYADFGDALTFDMTYKTMYKKPLGLFVGANHHMQCTIFAFALLGDETTDTFKWVFDTFLKCMGGVAPRCILTGMYAKIQFLL
jgi:hypothetical protein